MNKNEIVKKVSGAVNRVGFQLKKHSPEIFITVGVIGTIASAVIACKASTKVSSIIDDTREQLDAVHDAKEKYIDNRSDDA